MGVGYPFLLFIIGMVPRNCLFWKSTAGDPGDRLDILPDRLFWNLEVGEPGEVPVSHIFITVYAQ